jgi:hypothetical protein
MACTDVPSKQLTKIQVAVRRATHSNTSASAKKLRVTEQWDPMLLAMSRPISLEY